MAGKKFGEMTHAEKMAAMKRAADLLTDELTRNAPAISRILDEAEHDLASDQPCRTFPSE